MGRKWGGFCEQAEKSHGRIEKRRCRSVTDRKCIVYINDKGDWSVLSSVAMVECERVAEEVSSSQRRYYISGLRVDAKALLETARAGK